jgi:hypothetical protein
MYLKSNVRDVMFGNFANAVEKQLIPSSPILFELLKLCKLVLKLEVNKLVYKQVH